MIIWLCVGCLPGSLAAQQNDAASTAATANGSDTTGDDEGSTTAAADEATLFAERLVLIQDVIDSKIAERDRLREELETVEESEQQEIRESVSVLNDEIERLRDTLANLATGGADARLFDLVGSEQKTDWREDLVLVAQPVLDSLKDLTEKPRRISELNERIARRQLQREEAEAALTKLTAAREATENESLLDSLNRLESVWRNRFNEARDDIDVARVRLEALDGDTTLLTTMSRSLQAFLRGRGLTLLLAVLAAGSVWLTIRYLLRGYRRTLVSRDRPNSRTRYRLAEYSVRVITSLLVLLAVFVVFYERGDVLLLGLLFLLIAGLALSVRQLLPRYVREARLLLNVGPLREGERVFYAGLPWRVETINVYSIMRNPELTGILRLPLSSLHEVNSRPIDPHEPWFPTSRGDCVLLDGQDFAEVISQGVDTVELRSGGGQVRAVPSADFYAMNMINLSRGEHFGVWTSFGIDYRHQSIAVDEVPRMLRAAVTAEIESSDIGEYLRDMVIELKAAGGSSLDYLLFVLFDSRAAKSYLRVERMLQRGCIAAANDHALDIPFPHLSIVRKPAKHGEHPESTAAS